MFFMFRNSKKLQLAVTRYKRTKLQFAFSCNLLSLSASFIQLHLVYTKLVLAHCQMTSLSFRKCMAATRSLVSATYNPLLLAVLIREPGK